ncbi:MAG TPA: hypothetical protein VNL15_01320 [Dehalococcoidia bacterium]|nr:hypothetical protein [Dehalococcoidia bacterium]
MMSSASPLSDRILRKARRVLGSPLRSIRRPGGDGPREQPAVLDPDEFRRFQFQYPVSSRSWDIKQTKLGLIAQVGRAASLRDFGGLWGVHGFYLLEGARALGCRYAQMIDGMLSEEFEEKARALQASTRVQVEMKQADFREPDLYKSLALVEVSLLFDVMLHEDNPEEIIKNVLSRTTRYVCLAQPVLKEELFILPNGTVNLQFYPNELKDLLRDPYWWPPEPVIPRFDPAYWMWGQTVSYLKSVFHGYGWEMQHLEAYNLSRCWNYALLRFVPREG